MTMAIRKHNKLIIINNDFSLQLQESPTPDKSEEGSAADASKTTDEGDMSGNETSDDELMDDDVIPDDVIDVGQENEWIYSSGNIVLK